MLEFTETAEEMMDSWNDQSKVTKSTNGQLEFLGGGQPVN